MARTWDFNSSHVEEVTGASHEQFISGKSTLILAGPPALDAAEYSLQFFHIGFAENAVLSQNRVLQRLYEIGSEMSYILPGPASGVLSLGRALFHGRSLQRVLYAYYNIQDSDAEKLIPEGATVDSPSNKPGSGSFWLNLASDMFARPMGLGLVFDDQRPGGTHYGGIFLQNAFIQSHQLSISSATVIIAEGVTIQYESLVPMASSEETGITLA